MVSYRYGDNLSGSRLCVPKKNALEVIDAGPFCIDEPTLGFFQLEKKIFQVTPTKLILVT